jgi:hypothetical protein
MKKITLAIISAAVIAYLVFGSALCRAGSEIVKNASEKRCQAIEQAWDLAK